MIEKNPFDPANRFKATSNTVSAGTRLGNYLIDLLVTLPVNIFLYMQFMDINWETGEMAGSRWTAQLVTWFFTMGYYFFLESAFGKSVGKMITGTKVVNAWGEQPDLGSIALRSVCRLIPFEAFSFFGPKTIGWHDSLSKTYVVRKDFQGEDHHEDILDA